MSPLKVTILRHFQVIIQQHCKTSQGFKADSPTASRKPWGRLQNWPDIDNQSLKLKINRRDRWHNLESRTKASGAWRDLRVLLIKVEQQARLSRAWTRVAKAGNVHTDQDACIHAMPRPLSPPLLVPRGMQRWQQAAPCRRALVSLPSSLDQSHTNAATIVVATISCPSEVLRSP